MQMLFHHVVYSFLKIISTEVMKIGGIDILEL